MSAEKSGLRSALGRARGLGSAKEGVHHWWVQRVSAVALVPLTIWFVLSLYSVVGGGYEAMVGWVSSPVVAVLLVTLIIATFYHASLGLQVVYEDYISHHWVRVGVDLGTKFICFLLGAAGVFAVVKIAVGG